MSDIKVKALVEPDSENAGQLVLLSPAVGLFRPQLPKGAYVTPDLKMGTFNQLQHSSDLVVPQGARGAVIEQLVADGVNKVQFRTPLLRIGAATAEQMEAAAIEDENRAGTSSGGDIAVRSPTDGIFYRKPDPEAPPYVAVGDVITPGTRLGLVEVMKCFNQIRLEGDTLPSRCEVIHIPVEDGCEVTLGQVLFVLKEG